MIDSYYKARNFRLDSQLMGSFSPHFCALLLFFFVKARREKSKEEKKRRPLFCKNEHRGSEFFFRSSYACSRGPSPCSHPCICTCMSPACCSRWRSCCSGSVLKSTHPHLKENGSKTFSCGARMKRLRQNRGESKGKWFSM